MINRVAERLVAMARETKHRRECVKANLQWEMARVGMSVRSFWEKLCVELIDEKPMEQTVLSWVDGKVGNLELKHREAIARVFGYDDPSSITRPNHVKGREQQLLAESSSRPSMYIDGQESISRILVAVDQSTESSPAKTRAVIEDVLHSPLAPYLAMTAYLLRSKLTFAEAHRLTEPSQHQID